MLAGISPSPPLADYKMKVMIAAFYPKFNILQLSAPRKKCPSTQREKGARRAPGVLKNAALPLKTIEKICQPLGKIYTRPKSKSFESFTQTICSKFIHIVLQRNA